MATTITQKPNLLSAVNTPLIYILTERSSSTYNGNLFAYSTGSQLDIQTTIATANQNTWTNIAVSASPSSNDQVLQLQLHARSTGSATASFSDILIQ